MIKNLITRLPDTELDIQWQKVAPDRWKTTIIHRLKQEKNEIKGLITSNMVIKNLINIYKKTHNLIMLFLPSIVI